MNNDDVPYSPLMDTLRHAFEMHARNESNAYLFVFWQSWGQSCTYRTVAKGQYPWAVYDQFKAHDDEASNLVLGFDLSKSFAEQIPPHMRGFQTLDALVIKPHIHIPDRTGVVPAERTEQLIAGILKPPPPKLSVVR